MAFEIWDLGFFLALFGYWLPWLDHPAAALKLSGFDLAEWVTFLPGARDGSLPFGRTMFLAPLAALAVLAGLFGSRQEGWLRWLLPALGLLLSLAVFPPLPELRQFSNEPATQVRLVLGFAALGGVLLTFLWRHLPEWLGRLAQAALALIALYFGIAGFWQARPLASELLNAPFAIGVGWGIMLAGLLLLMAGAVGNQKAP